MKLHAPAKINPFLSVGARQLDGLHQITSIMQSVSLYDTVSIEHAEALSITVSPDGSAPADDTNLVSRAARAYCAAHAIEPAYRLSLEKTIPTAAGLGGGSSDAAATLIGLNQMTGRVSRKALEKIAHTIGSDVPFCVRGGTALVGGTGEDLSALACPKPVWWVLIFGESSLATKDVYAAFDTLPQTEQMDPFEVADALARTDIERLANALFNALEPAALSIQPSLGDARDALRAAGALGVVLAGSGSTWCGLARDEEHARALADGFPRAAVVHSLEHGPRVTA